MIHRLCDHTNRRRLLFRLRAHPAFAYAVVIVFAGFFTACRQQSQPALPPAPAVVHDNVLSADSVRVCYEVRGSGERALVFVHCWCCDRTFWEKQVDEFAGEYKIVTVDLAGHGESGAEREVWSMAAYGADIAAVVHKLDLPNVILIGHSMGGTVMIEAARLLGNRVSALIGVDNLQNLERELSEEQITGYLAHFSADFPTATYEFVKGMFPAYADSELIERVSRGMAAAPEAVALGSFDQLFRYNYRTALSDVRVPIRCINSDEYPTDAEANNRVAASFKVIFMPGSGHFPHMVKPDEFNHLLRQTIEEFWPKPAGEQG